MGTLLSGIAASENIDSSGETLLMAGLDISTLVPMGVANFEHSNKETSQIVGKVIFAKKITSDADCENEDQLYFWGIAKSSFLYAIVELFDDVGHEGAENLAAIARYDEKMFKDGKIDFKSVFPLVGWSIEGSTLQKEADGRITSSLAKRIACTVGPCNKVCWTHIYNPKQETKKAAQPKKVSKIQDLLQNMLKSEELSSEQASLIKSEIQDMDKSGSYGLLAKNMTQSGKPISPHWDSEHNNAHQFSVQDHKDAMNHHYEAAAQTSHPETKQVHMKAVKQHMMAANKSPWSSKRTLASAPSATSPKTGVQSSIPTSAPKSAIPAYVNIPGANRGVLKSEAAGAPASRTGMAAVEGENLEKQMTFMTKKDMSKNKQMSQGVTPLMLSDLAKSEKMEKPAIDLAIPTWEKVEQFREWIGSCLPGLSKTEANAFTRAFKVFQIKKAEKKLTEL